MIVFVWSELKKFRQLLKNFRRVLYFELFNFSYEKQNFQNITVFCDIFAQGGMLQRRKRLVNKNFDVRIWILLYNKFCKGQIHLFHNLLLPKLKLHMGQVFKNGSSKICERQPLKDLKCLNRPYCFKFFKNCLP